MNIKSKIISVILFIISILMETFSKITIFFVTICLLFGIMIIIDQIGLLTCILIGIGFIVAILILSKLSWMHLDYKKKHNVLDLSDYRDCIIALMSKMMKADNDIKEHELDRSKSTIRRYFKTEEEHNEALKKFQNILDNDLIILNQICDNINKNLNYIAKRELIMELLAVAYADDAFLESEKLMIETIVDRLEITPQEYKSIYAIFLLKYKQGYYNDTCPTVYTPSGINPSDKKYDDNTHKSNENNTQNNEENHNTYRQYNGMSEDDAYSILGVEKCDSDNDIKKAYRTLAVKCHPDNAANLGDEAIRQATESMKQINMAWDVVKMARGIK